MKVNWQISAGEAFEVLRPAALVTSALLSAWVLASARRWRFRFLLAAGWSLGTLLFPFVILPLYLIARGSAKRRAQFSDTENKDHAPVSVASSARNIKGRYIWPLMYLVVLLSAIGFYLHREYNSVDGHLARAEQARVIDDRARMIREYRAALALEDNPHTHKLLGVELAEVHQWSEALSELRLAEHGGEADESLPFRIAQVLAATGDQSESVGEYQKFLASHACQQELPDDRCEIARKSVVR